MKLLYLHAASIDSNKANVIQALHMCCAFAELGLDVCLAIAADVSDPTLVRELVRKKIGKDVNFAVKPYPKISFCGRLSMIGGYPGVRHLLTTEEADYCFVRNAVYINATIKQEIPTIFECHVPVIHDNSLWDFVWTHNFLKNCNQATVVKFIAISQRLAESWIRKGVPPEKVIVLHDGVDVDSFNPAPDPKSLRKRLGFSSSKKIVLYAGRLYADQDVERILLLAERFPQACFVVIGGPAKRASYYAGVARQQQISNVHFSGPVPHLQVKDYLFAADVLLMIWNTKIRTINYCSPLKMFEYMAAGRIIVGDGFPTIHEVLSDGKNALLANPNSFDELTMKLRHALNMTYPNQMAMNARRLAFERYSWKIRASQILNSLGVTCQT